MRVLFVCVHNSGRSQMAEAIVNYLADERKLAVCAESAGTIGGDEINPIARQAMAEIGIGMHGQRPKLLTQEMVSRADKVVSMGCGVDAAACPTRFIVTEDWGLEDPAGQPIEKVREIRDQIRRRVSLLLDEYQRLVPLPGNQG